MKFNNEQYLEYERSEFILNWSTSKTCVFFLNEKPRKPHIHSIDYTFAPLILPHTLKPSHIIYNFLQQI